MMKQALLAFALLAAPLAAQVSFLDFRSSSSAFVDVRNGEPVLILVGRAVDIRFGGINSTTPWVELGLVGGHVLDDSFAGQWFGEYLTLSQDFNGWFQLSGQGAIRSIPQHYNRWDSPRWYSSFGTGSAWEHHFITCSVPFGSYSIPCDQFSPAPLTALAFRVRLR